MSTRDEAQQPMARSTEASAIVSPRLVREPRCALEFAREARWYEASVLPHSATADLVARYSDRIRLGSAVRTITAIPSYVGEDMLPRLIAKISKLAAPGTHHVVVFLNGPERLPRAQYDALVKVRREELRAAARQHRGLGVSWLEGRFPVIRMGTLRRILFDSIVIAALRARLRDPLVLSHDADQIEIAREYLRTARHLFDARPGLDGVTGPAHYGLEHRDADGKLPRPMRYPEIFLNGEFYRLEHEYAASRIIDGKVQPLILVGNNAVIRLASYCAIGGFDDSVHEGEDMELSYRLQTVRGGVAGGLAPAAREHVDHAAKLVVVTHARRLFHAVLSGRVGYTQWVDFEAVPSGMLDPRRQRREYLGRPDLLQLWHLERAAAGERQAEAMVRSRIKYVFRQSMRHAIQRQDDVYAMADRFGLALRSIRFFPRLGERDLLDDVSIDWRRSRLRRLLVEHARR